MNTHLIGISGKMFSGKSTLGRLLLYNSSDYNGVLLPDFIRDRNATEIEGSEFKLVHFEDKFLELASILTNQSKEFIVDNLYSPIGGEWARHFLKNPIHDSLIGKEEISVLYKVVEEKVTYKQLISHLAESLNSGVFNQLSIVSTFSHYNPKNMLVYDIGSYRKKCSMCKKTFSGAKTQKVCKECVDNQIPEYPKWIIADVKFPNQALKIKQLGGILIRVNRLRTIEEWAMEFRLSIRIPEDDSRKIDLLELSSFLYRSSQIKSNQVLDFIEYCASSNETAMDSYDGFDHILNIDGNLDNLTSEAIELSKQLNIFRR